MKVLKTVPANWPPVAQYMFSMARVYRNRAKGWRANIKSAPNCSMYVAQMETHIRRDREEVQLFMQWIRVAIQHETAGTSYAKAA